MDLPSRLPSVRIAGSYHVPGFMWVLGIRTLVLTLAQQRLFRSRLPSWLCASRSLPYLLHQSSQEAGAVAALTDEETQTRRSVKPA